MYNQHRPELNPPSRPLGPYHGCHATFQSTVSAEDRTLPTLLVLTMDLPRDVYSTTLETVSLRGFYRRGGAVCISCK